MPNHSKSCHDNSKSYHDDCNDYDDDCNDCCDDSNDCDDDNHCHDDCKPCHDCCTKTDTCNLKPNCVTKCCNPLVCECEDVEQSHCVPILAEKIFDCICLDHLQFAEASELTFTIENFDPTTMKTGMPICIDKVSTTFDFIGADLTELEIKLGKKPITLTAVCPTDDLADCFEGCTKTTKACCDGKQGLKTRISTIESVEFQIKNLVITITGKIGCACFVATSKTEGPTALSELFPAISKTSIFSKICLPKESRKLKLNLCFDPCLSVDCVVPNPTTFAAPSGTDPATIDADVEVSFLVNSEVTATTTEKLGVFVTDKEIKCHTASSDSGCKSKCH